MKSKYCVSMSSGIQCQLSILLCVSKLLLNSIIFLLICRILLWLIICCIFVWWTMVRSGTVLVLQLWLIFDGDSSMVLYCLCYYAGTITMSM